VAAGLGVLPNAVRALTGMGVSRRLYCDAGPFRRFRICNQRGEELNEVAFERAFRRMGGDGYVMHRKALHAAISECVDPGSVRMGACVTAIEQSEGGVSVHVAGEAVPISGDLLLRKDSELVGALLRKDTGLVDAPGRRVVGAKGKSPF